MGGLQINQVLTCPRFNKHTAGPGEGGLQMEVGCSTMFI